MKKLLLTSSSLLALMAVAPAFAADLPAQIPLKTPAIVPNPYFTWTGCYLGGQVGGGWAHTEIADVPPNNLLIGNGVVPGSLTVNTSGFLGGGQLGCNYQFATNWMVGIEGDIVAANLSGNGNSLLGVVTSIDVKTNWVGSATGRVGYTWNRALFYLKGGAAWAGDKYRATDYLGSYLAASETRSGWTLGVGLEWAFANDWSAKLEYDYYDFGNRSVNFVPVTSIFTATPESVDQRIQTVKLGINYRFWIGGSSVVAKY
jgi:outer membrane immunogenic protein